jgi:hypothetical protein
MKRASLLAAAAVVLIANAFALVHAWRNRTGAVDAELVLTDRELICHQFSRDENSGVALSLLWLDPDNLSWLPWRPESAAPWLDQRVLRELGFDTSVAATDKAAYEYYARQRARRAFVALEYDETTWRKLLESSIRLDQEHPELHLADIRKGIVDSSTRLVAIDADLDATRLRARHPDRGKVIVAPAVIRITLEYSRIPYGVKRPPPRPQLRGYIQEVPAVIHVPLPFSDALRTVSSAQPGMKYRVRIRYGAALEPWVAGVELAAPAAR